MTILIDASAFVAMATDEPETPKLAAQLNKDVDRVCCSLGLWEAAMAIARKTSVGVSQAGRSLESLRVQLGVRVVSIGEAETMIAMHAHERYGKGTGHLARLNMGDCFAYACAKTNNARLLYKGDDFSQTDLA